MKTGENNEKRNELTEAKVKMQWAYALKIECAQHPRNASME